MTERRYRGGSEAPESMNCPRCQLPNPRTTLVCARCGELTPRPNASPFETRPPAEGPRFAPSLGREIGLDRRGRGVRAMNVPVQTPPPLRVRSSATPAWSRPVRETPSKPQQRIIAASALAADPAPLHLVPMPSLVAQAKTEPQWHREPEPPPEPATPAADEAPREAPVAPLGRRALAAAIDVAVVGAVTCAALGLGAIALGPAALAPQLDRGFDFVLDGLLIGRGLGLIALAFALVVAFTYVTLAHALGGATLGKHATGLRLVGPDGDGLSLRESAWRSVACAVSTVIGFGGLAYAWFDPSRRTLHDLLVGTRVVDRRAEPTPAWFQE